ncbi:extracellular lipase [Diplodia corticola]|uniref:Carboxylic ester hydrolase n=1 Tax=Diplodia corticola TaxID=236234 RepID=A0A1J9QNH9_9PEZI|nr:extracellular lipase [Diplodia corticola]OJD30016.1 extracellular lipase [Diplodia corticola]
MRSFATALLTAAISFEGVFAADPLVHVRNGTYTGLHLPQFGQDLFLGIPYAQSTDGQNRFRIPQPLTATWNGTRDAKSYGHACPDADPADDAIYGMSEDCLNINLVRPSGQTLARNGTKLPVMLWIHGGSYQQGTSGLSNYNLTWIVQRSVEIGSPIIGASINYRKGGWGNMYSIEIQGSGNTNLALRDMRQALAWIQENIVAFGGDPDSVTIWGESSGSFAVGQLLMTYGGRTDGLFHRSIQESGSAATAWYNGSEWYQPIYNKIVDQVNCSSAVDTLACLRTVPYATLYPFMNSSIVGGPGFYPTVDGDIMPAYPTELLHAGRFAHLPHLYGTNSDEGSDNAPADGSINTSADLRHFLLHRTGFGFPPAAVDRILALYPDDPAAGIPLDTGPARFPALGWQYKRAAAIVGDVFYHAPRLDDARHYARWSPDTYVYRFNTRAFVQNATTTENATYLNPAFLPPAYKGVAHFSEVAFVFGNPDNVGPWAEYRQLSRRMSDAWIRFAWTGRPEGECEWPRYGEGEKGLNMVLQTETQGGCYVEEDTYRLAGREYLTEWARRRHV